MEAFRDNEKAIAWELYCQLTNLGCTGDKVLRRTWTDIF